MVLSRVSTSVIAGGIADIKAFQREPIFYAYGMVNQLDQHTIDFSSDAPRPPLMLLHLTSSMI